MKKIAVVALGGNALLRGSEKGTIQQQEKNTYETCKHLLNIVKDYRLIITHGNGPQVGNILLRNEAGYNNYKIPKMPLDICVADSQGGIGYLIERQLMNVLQENNIEKNIATIVTQVLVDISDPAFEEPTKPIGAFYLKEEADLLARVNGWKFKQDSRKRGWRRIVASPKPEKILNINVINELIEKDNIVIATGGGGIPVYQDKNKNYNGVEAVIDKDASSALLAKEINADAFFILTDVPKVYINFQKPGQKGLDTITVEEAKKYYDEGHFSSGSMGPKILSAIEYINNSRKEVIIAEAAGLTDKNPGTRIIPDSSK